MRLLYKRFTKRIYTISDNNYYWNHHRDLLGVCFEKNTPLHLRGFRFHKLFINIFYSLSHENATVCICQL